MITEMAPAISAHVAIAAAIAEMMKKGINKRRAIDESVIPAMPRCCFLVSAIIESTSEAVIKSREMSMGRRTITDVSVTSKAEQSTASMGNKTSIPKKGTIKIIRDRKRSATDAMYINIAPTIATRIGRIAAIGKMIPKMAAVKGKFFAFLGLGFISVGWDAGIADAHSSQTVALSPHSLPHNWHFFINETPLIYLLWSGYCIKQTLLS